MPRFMIPILIFLFIFPASLQGQSLAELMQQASQFSAAGDQLNALKTIRQAYIQQWLKTPLSASTAVFVSKPSDGFGKYHARPDNVFKSGEKILVYIEPIGFIWGQSGSVYEIEFVADFSVSTAAGKVLGGQKKFQTVGLKSLVRNTEFFISLTYNFSGIPKGDYILSTTLNDSHSNKKTSIDMPFSIR